MRSAMLDDRDVLQFNDARSCKLWLTGLPLANVAIAHREIVIELAKLDEAPVAALERLKILEVLREPVAFLQDQLRSVWIGRTLPLNHAELETWTRALSLWRAMAVGYRRCLKAYDEDNREIAEHAPLVCQRCLYYLARQAADFHSAYRQVDAALWEELHELYEYAAERGFATRKVRDKLDRDDQTSTCSARYAHALLADQANPFGLTAEELELVDRLLDKWSKKVSFTADYDDAEGDHKLAVDLAGRAGAQHIGASPSGRGVRYLGVKALSKSLRKRITLLREGYPPDELGLGNDDAGHASELLTTLYNQWCGDGHGRRFPRRDASGEAGICTGIPSIHYFVGERIFTAPDQHRGYTAQENRDLQTFGHIRAQTVEAQAAQLGFALERWQLFNESVTGFGLFRGRDSAIRVGHRQLIAIRAADAAGFTLCVVEWLRHDSKLQLHLGVRTIAGTPRPVAARGTSGSQKFAAALLLEEMPALHEPASLLLAGGPHVAGQEIELYDDDISKVKIVRTLEKGRDFERVAFEPLA